MTKYKILDWAGNEKISYELFDSFEDAWDKIYETFEHIEDEKEYYETVGEFQVIEVSS